MSFVNWKENKVFYRQQGSGPDLLVLPGNTATSICHQGEIDYFKSHYRVTSIDFLGTGHSDRVSEWPVDWFKQCAQQVQALLEHLNINECILMGTSGGASIALLAAIHFPERIKAVIADSGMEFLSKETTEIEIIEDRKQRTGDQIGFWKFAQGTDWEQVVNADSDMLVRFAEQGGDCFAGQLKNITCPVLLTGSKADQSIPDILEQFSSMAAQIPGCRLYVHHQGSHPLMWSSPDDFRAVSDYFLRSLKFES
ncbi:MAG: alpha/beta hydrolase [Anaerolineaceae bacterium]|nr:alpha/beta hydrolase [Anaerolineaceae bacterium]